MIAATPTEFAATPRAGGQCGITSRIPVMPSLREPRKIFGLGFSLFLLRGHKLLRLFSHIVQHGGIAGEFLNAALPIQLSVKSGFQAANREWTALQNIVGPGDSFGFEIGD